MIYNRFPCYGAMICFEGRKNYREKKETKVKITYPKVKREPGYFQVLIKKDDKVIKTYKKLSKLELPKDVKNIIRISALEDKGIDELKNFIKKIYNLENIETEDLTYLSNARSISLLEKAYGCIEEIEKGLDNNMPIDMVEIDIKNMWSILGEIIGETYQDELINQLFSQFCLGK